MTRPSTPTLIGAVQRTIDALPLRCKLMTEHEIEFERTCLEAVKARLWEAEEREHGVWPQAAAPSRQSASVQNVAGTALVPEHPTRERAAAGPRRLRVPLLRIGAVAATCAIFVGVSVALIDRPVATWVHEHLGDERFGWFKATYDGYSLSFGPFSLMASPAEALVPLAALLLVVLAIAASAGWRPGIGGRIVLALCLSILVAIKITSFLKLAFGRTWPESWLGDSPSWIRDGVFGFFPFHHGVGWDSFPSGHTAVITATATILWLVWPELRVVWATMVGVIVVGLIGGNYHFVSDVIGGFYLGALIGLGITGLILSPDDRVVLTAGSPFLTNGSSFRSASRPST